jgi:hypothetical protein
VAEADDAMRERLAAALTRQVGRDWRDTVHTTGTLADALLPTVRAIVADELRAAADGFTPPVAVPGAEKQRWHHATIRQWLHGRADKLDPR